MTETLDDARLRLKLSREKSGKTHDEVASAIGIGVSSYYDLELCEGDFEHAISLGEIHQLCNYLHLDQFWLFSGEVPDLIARTPFSALVTKIKEHLGEKGISIQQFEGKVGFLIASCLENHSSMLEWSIECLQDVCAEVSVDWKAVVPELDANKAPKALKLGTGRAAPARQP